MPKWLKYGLLAFVALLVALFLFVFFMAANMTKTETVQGTLARGDGVLACDLWEDGRIVAALDELFCRDQAKTLIGKRIEIKGERRACSDLGRGDLTNTSCFLVHRLKSVDR